MCIRDSRGGGGHPHSERRPLARQSIWVGLLLSGIAMAAAGAGYIAPVVGALLQEGIDVAVILNALRASAPAIRARRVTSAIP